MTKRDLPNGARRLAPWGIVAISAGLLLAGTCGARAQTVPPAAQPVIIPLAAGNPPPTSVIAPKSAINIRKIRVEISPLAGASIEAGKWPGLVQQLTSKDISAGGTPNMVSALNRSASGVNLTNSQANPYQPTLIYHGFTLSPIQGTPAGLSVYVNGARFNVPFGDLAIWSLLPDAAIHSLSVEDSNPLFGLNALGGAISVHMKNGFNYHGGEAALSGGSFGKIEANLQYGVQRGNVAAYADIEERHEEGWRNAQASDLQNFYGDLGWRGNHAELHVSATLAHSALNGPGSVPVQLLAADPRAEFTGPNSITDKYAKLVATLNDRLTPATSVQAVLYYDYLRETLVNGNGPNDLPCGVGPYQGYLCQGGTYADGNAPATQRGGGLIPDFAPTPNAYGYYPYGSLALNTTNTSGYGGSAQISNKLSVLGLKNHLIAGVSYDGGFTNYDAATYDGGLNLASRIYDTPTGVPNPGYKVDEPGAVPVGEVIRNAYYGAYLSDSLDVTKRLTLTLGGRFNIANIVLHNEDPYDPNAPAAGLNGRHYYTHFNPAIGYAYQITPLTTFYGGYSEANAAPTPAELSCASPAASCTLANFLSGDPNLKQIIARTFEVGLRGAALVPGGATLTYNLDYYHTVTNDDIEFLQSPYNPLGAGYFGNVGNVKREGADLSLKLDASRWHAYFTYSRINATYENSFVVQSNSPASNGGGNITITPGNYLPGIPRNMFKMGGSYDVTPKWSVGLSANAQTSSYLYGDQSNQEAPLPGVFTVNFNTRYKVTKRLEVFGEIDNLTDARYYEYGTFSPTGLAGGVYVAQAPNYNNPRSYSIAAPIAGYAGIKVKF